MADRKQMGMGVIGRPDITLKRNFRWTFEVSGFCGSDANKISESFVKVAARPSLDVDEIEINHLNAKMFLPGKATWDTLSVTYYDAATDEMRNLWNWLVTVHEFTDPVNLRQGTKKDWAATGVLNMYDSTGGLIESWQLLNMFPKAVDFGELAYDDGEVSTIALTLRYSDVKYRSYCPDYTPVGCYTSCGA